MTISGAAGVPVLFATNRAKLPVDGSLSHIEDVFGWGKQGGGLYAEGKIGDSLIFGKCTVPLPSSRVRGALAAGQPESVEEMDLTDEIRGRNILILVHGYNNNFVDAVQAAARVKSDMPWDGPLVVFSWASWGHTDKYIADEVIQGNSVDSFVQFLAKLQVSEVAGS